MTDTWNAGDRGFALARATNGAQPYSGTNATRMRLVPSQRSIRSSPERRNSSSEPPISSCLCASSTVKLTGNVCERSRPHPGAEFFEPKADTALNRAERQSGCIGDFLVRLAADERAADQVCLARRQAIYELPQQLGARG